MRILSLNTSMTEVHILSLKPDGPQGMAGAYP